MAKITDAEAISYSPPQPTNIVIKAAATIESKETTTLSAPEKDDDESLYDRIKRKYMMEQ